jgi:ketosteroid isomerase-like protein
MVGRRSSFAIAVALALGVIVSIASARVIKRAEAAKGTSEALTPQDVADIRALDARFVRGWLDNDRAAVLGVYAPDAILFPPGTAPLHGIAAIRAFWWPADGSRTRITKFERTIDEIDGTQRLAFLRGTSSLAWNYEKDGQTTTQTSRSTDLFLLTCDAEGHWHVIRQIWNTLPE